MISISGGKRNPLPLKWLSLMKTNGLVSYSRKQTGKQNFLCGFVHWSHVRRRVVDLRSVITTKLFKSFGDVA